MRRCFTSDPTVRFDAHVPHTPALSLRERAGVRGGKQQSSMLPLGLYCAAKHRCGLENAMTTP